MALSETQLARRVGTVGLVVLVATVVLFLRLEGEHLRPGLRVHVELERSGALTVGAPVVLAGRHVGTIDDIRLVPRVAPAASYAQDPTAERAGVVLDVWIDRRWAHALHENSELFQNQPSILAEAYLEIGPARGVPAGPPVRDGATLRGADPPRMDQIAQRSYENLRNVIDLIRNGFPEARVLGRELGQLSTALDQLSSPADRNALSQARVRLWAEALAAWSDWKAADVSGEDLSRVAAHARATIARTRDQVAALRTKLDVFVTQLDALRVRLGPERFARFEQALTQVDELTRRADVLLAHAEEITAMVARGEGTIGAFLNDTELADDFKAMTKILKERPWEMVGHPQK